MDNGHKGGRMKKKQRIEMEGDANGSGLAYGYADGKLVCALCGKAATKSRLKPVPLVGGRSAGACQPCANIVVSFASLLDLALELSEQDDMVDELAAQVETGDRKFVN